MAQQGGIDVITQEYLKSILDYKPETGGFIWIEAGKGRRNDRVPGYISPDGYRMIKINYRLYTSSKLAWLYMTGFWPKCHVDHIDGIRDNDSFENLREATTEENNRNHNKRKLCSSKYKGVYFHKKSKKWLSTIWNGEKSIYLGSFNNELDAHEEYAKIAIKKHGEFFKPCEYKECRVCN